MELRNETKFHKFRSFRSKLSINIKEKRRNFVIYICACAPMYTFVCEREQEHDVESAGARCHACLLHVNF